MLGKNKGVYGLLVLATVLWGSTAAVSKVVSNQIPPITTALLRFLLVTVMMFPYLWFVEKAPRPKGRDLLLLIWMGFIGVYLHNMLFLAGIKFSTATNGALINAIYPGMTALILFFFYRETLRPLQVVGIILSLIGVGLIVTKGSLEVLLELKFNLGDIFLSITAITWPVYTLIGRRMGGSCGPAAAIAYSSLFGTIFLLPTALFMEPMSIHPSSWSFSVLLKLFYLGFVNGGLAYIWWNQGVLRLGPNRSAIFMNIVPLSGIIFAVFFLREHVMPSQIAGGLFIIFGIILTNFLKGDSFNFRRGGEPLERRH